MGYRFCDFLNLARDILCKESQKDEIIEDIFFPGIPDSEWINPIHTKSSSFKRLVASGERFIPANNAKAINAQFSGHDEYIEKINSLSKDSKTALSKGLKEAGFRFENPNQDIGPKIWYILNSFLFAFQQGTDQIATDSPRPEQIQQLLQETDMKCPLCDGDLIIKRGPFIAENFDVHHIFPTGAMWLTSDDGESIICDNPDSSSNKILLCKKHNDTIKKMNEYERYEKLKQLKDYSINKHNLNYSDAHEVITRILEEVHTKASLPDRNNIDSSPRWDPLTIERKIDKNQYGILVRNIKADVADYFDFIKDQIASLESGPHELWVRFAKTVHEFYVENQDLDSFTIIEIVSTHILKISGLASTARNKSGCDILSSFFVQNCEVFDEISK